MKFSARERRGLIVLAVISLIVITIGLVLQRGEWKSSDNKLHEEKFYKRVIEISAREESSDITILEQNQNKVISKHKKNVKGKRKGTKGQSQTERSFRNYLSDTIKVKK